MALEGGEGSASRPGHSLPKGKTRYPLYRRVGGPQGRFRKVRKISPLLGFDPRTVQPVASYYNNDTLLYCTLLYLLTLLLSYLLTYSADKSHLKKLTSSQPVKKLPEFYATRRFIASFTSARQLSLFRASSIQSIPLHSTS
jgi:hypothetical protein